MLFSGSFKKTKGSLIEWEEADTHQTAPQPKQKSYNHVDSWSFWILNGIHHLEDSFYFILFYFFVDFVNLISC